MIYFGLGKFREGAETVFMCSCHSFSFLSVHDFFDMLAFVYMGFDPFGVFFD